WRRQKLPSRWMRTGSLHYKIIWDAYILVFFAGKATEMVRKTAAGKLVKPSAQTLKDSEIRYRRLFEAAQDGILILDAQTGMIDDVNPYLIKMLGYSREEFVEKKLWEVGAFRDIEASKDAFEVLQEKEYIRYEDLPLKTKDGRLIQVEFVSNVYLVGDEKVIQCDIRDITEHRQIIAALQGNEKQYHDLINQSPDGYFIIDLSGNILTVNKAMCKELEFSEEEFLSMNIWDIIPERFLDQYRERLTKILKGESLKEAAEYEVHGKSGKTHYVEVLSAPRYSGKNIIGFQGIARDITARLRAEDALRQAEEKYRTIFENAVDAITRTTLDGKFLSANPAAARQLGYNSPEELIADIGAIDRRFYVKPGRRQEFKRLMEEHEKITRFESEIYRKDGSTIWISENSRLVRNKNGDSLYYEGTTEDITERKQAEEMLQTSHLIIEGIINAIPVRVFWKDKNLVYLGCNVAFAHDAGLTDPKDVIGKDDYQMGWRDQAELYRGDDRQVIESGSSKLFIEEPQTTPEGNIITLLTSKVPLQNSKGEVIGVLGMYMDITERKRAQEALRESEERFRALIENASDMIVAITVEGNLSYVSPAVQRISGYQVDEALGRNIVEFIHADDMPFALESLASRSQISGLAPAPIELRFRHKDGTWRIVEVLGNNLLDHLAVKGIVLNVRDITE
ncbi:hypothetical protein ANRL2_04185, partial [Anaerolineae bacterium]